MARISATTKACDQRPLLFSTLLLPQVRDVIAQSDALILDLFEMFIAPLEAELGISSSHAVSRSHGVGTRYTARMDAANYPLVPEDFTTEKLPEALGALHNKLHGLTIHPQRLQQIRAERSPNSGYAALGNCRLEVQQAESLMRQANIPFLDVTSMSVEEIATTILHQAGLKR